MWVEKWRYLKVNENISNIYKEHFCHDRYQWKWIDIELQWILVIIQQTAQTL